MRYKQDADRKDQDDRCGKAANPKDYLHVDVVSGDDKGLGTIRVVPDLDRISHLTGDPVPGDTLLGLCFRPDDLTVCSELHHWA